METRKHYTTNEVNNLANYLFQLHEQGTPLDYEIRLDKFVVVPRTSDPQRFYDYTELLQSSTREMSVLIYKGASRVSDSHVFVLSDAPAPAQIPTFEQQLEAALEQDRAEAIRKYELDKLKGLIEEQRKKIKKQKRRIKQQKKMIVATGSESAGLAKVLKDLAVSPAVKGLFPSTIGETGSAAADLGALPDAAVLSYLKDYRAKLGEEVFQQLLGTTLTMAQRPELIAQIRAFITDQTNAA